MSLAVGDIVNSFADQMIFIQNKEWDFLFRKGNMSNESRRIQIGNISYEYDF